MGKNHATSCTAKSCIQRAMTGRKGVFAATGNARCLLKSPKRKQPKTNRGSLRGHIRASQTMLKNFTIRRGLTITIAGYTAALVVVLLAAVACLRQSNQALEQMYTTDTVALTHLKTSSERLLQVRLSLGSFETLFMLGKAGDDLLPNARKTAEGQRRRVQRLSRQASRRPGRVARASREDNTRRTDQARDRPRIQRAFAE